MQWSDGGMDGRWKMKGKTRNKREKRGRKKKEMVR
jgi:hypothetical protein